MIYDISMEIHPNMQTYKNSLINKPIIKINQSHLTNDVHDTTVTLNLHTGTHIDYPLHMIKDGANSETENLESLIGKARVLDLTSITDKITKEDLEEFSILENEIVLFKTKNSFSEGFLDDFVYLDESGAQYLLNKKVKAAGTDALGIERLQQGHPTHKILLGNDIVIIEGLRLKEVPEGTYEFIFLPLKIKNVEAALGRAILKTISLTIR